jgi:hypothetical protein
MTTGLLWFDNSALSLAEKIARAAEYYQHKYEKKPELCLVHPDALNNQDLSTLEGITVRPWKSCLPHHLIIGIEDMPATEVAP